MRNTNKKNKKKRPWLLLGVALCALALAFLLPGKGKSFMEAQARDAMSYAGGPFTVGPATPLRTGKDWRLTLVNKDNPLPSDYAFTLKTLPNGEKIDSRVYESITRMLEDGTKEGLSFVVCSGYRSVETQTKLYNKKVKYYKEKGMNEVDAKREAATVVAAPGTSEHHLGLAADIVAHSYQSLDDAQANTPEQQWLMKNCYKYGFILRYPSSKTDSTGVIYEPWHYRYVGEAAAKEITERGITLEEYLGVH